mgnify:CR=1 FL=1
MQKIDNFRARIDTLERELETLIAYLKRLPVVPETAAAIRNAEQALSNQREPEVLVGEVTTPVGFVPVCVELIGDLVTVSSRVPESTAYDLWKTMTSGVTVRLQPR